MQRPRGLPEGSAAVTATLMRTELRRPARTSASTASVCVAENSPAGYFGLEGLYQCQWVGGTLTAQVRGHED